MYFPEVRAPGKVARGSAARGWRWQFLVGVARFWHCYLAAAVVRRPRCAVVGGLKELSRIPMRSTPPSLAPRAPALHTFAGLVGSL